MSAVPWQGAGHARQCRAGYLPGLPGAAQAGRRTMVADVSSWGGDHPDGPEPSRLEMLLGLVLLAVVLGAAVVGWVIMLWLDIRYG